MSMQDGGQGQEAGTSTTIEPNVTGDNTQGQQAAPEDDFSNHPFMQSIDEADRPIVGKYIKQWDAGVTRRMMENSQKYRPYEELGDVDSLKRAKEIYEYLRDNPQLFYQELTQKLGISGTQPNLQQGQGPEGFEEFQPYLQQVQTQFQQELAKRDQALQQVLQFVQSQQEQTRIQQEDQQLVQYMNLLHDELGDFDDRFVLGLMSTGLSGEQAVQQYRQAVQQQVNQQRTPPVGTPILSGGGAPPSQEKRPEEMSRQEVKGLVAKVLEASQTSG